jgi:8-oxo-dGTP diphosphatase
VSDEAVPRFGVAEPGAEYYVRPGAYGVLLGRDALLAVVRAPRGFHLPGGGSEPGESPEETLAREALEEAGLRVVDPERIREAWEYVHAADGRHYRIQGVFLRGRAEASGEPGRERDHRLVWMTAEEALDRLTPGSHRWAVARRA